MKALLQRVKFARVEVEGECVGEINQGLLVFLGLEKHDDEAAVTKMMTRLLNYRVFSDEDGKMNLSIHDVNGAALVVSQLTLASDWRKGRRPSFTSAAAPEEGERLYEYFCGQLRTLEVPVETGEFGAMMDVHLINDGPVTFVMDSRENR